MRIAILMPISPFIRGGSEKMADDLVYYFGKYGHRAKRYDTTPYGGRLRSASLGSYCSKTLRFDDDVDIVIPLLPLNANVDHPNIVPWLISQVKALYDFFTQQHGFSRFGAEGDIIRELVIREDTAALRALERVYTISPHVKELLLKYNNVNAETLILPLETNGRYSCKEYGDYFLYHSRLHSQKRQHLAIEAMCYTKTPVKLVIAGVDNEPEYVSKMKAFIDKHDLSSKVKLIVGHFSNEQKIAWLSECLGGFYLGENEDYWAIVTTELMLSKKPVIAPLDTGATRYVVQDGITGLQPEGTPQAIAKAMDELYLDKKAAKRMGEAGDELIRKISPSWETVVRTLTGEW